MYFVKFLFIAGSNDWSSMKVPFFFLFFFPLLPLYFLMSFSWLLVYPWNALWPLSLINKNLGMVSYWGKLYYFIVKSLFSNWGPFYVFRVIKFSSFSGPSSHSEDLLVCENNSWWIYFCRKPLVCASTGFIFLEIVIFTSINMLCFQQMHENWQSFLVKF